MKKKLLLFFTFFCVFGLHQNIKGQTLGPGDIAFIGFDIGGQDGFSFIALKNLPAGEIVYFTEEGLYANGWIASNEPHIKWTIPAGVTCGKIISVIETATNTFTVTGGLASDFVINPEGPAYNFNLSSGDQMLAYQSVGNVMRPVISPTTITFLAGIHGDFNSSNYDPDTHWNNDEVLLNLGGAESIIPPGLTNGVNCVALFPGVTEPSQYFAKYTGTLTGTSTALRASINNYSNWTITSASTTPPGTTQGILPSNYSPNLTCTSVPTVTTTTPATNIGALTATLGGFNNNGGDTGTLDRGIVWSLTTNPVIGGGGVTKLSTATLNGIGTFTVNVTGLPPGIPIYYRAYAENSVGIGYGNTASFTTNAALSATQSQTNTCNGTNNGTATVVPSGGKSPYTYAWSNGSTAATITGLSPSNYSVNITDGEGTSITKIFNITQNSIISGTTTISNVSCNGGNNGSIDLTPIGGSGSYTYNWGGGITTQDRTNLAAGTYSVTITDSNNCSVVVSNIAVGQPAALGGTTVVTNVACNGGNTGAINLTPTGGIGPYTFLWNDLVTTTEDRTGLTAGTYSVTITDANSCQVTINSITVIQPPAITGIGSTTQVACYGGNTGAINVTPGGGIGPYTYIWDDGPTTEDRTGLTAGTYSIKITDANSCQRTFSYTINQPAAALSAATGGGKTDVSCNGGNNGTATVAPTGGTPTYTYSWNTTPVQTTATATGLAVGTYTVTVTDANACQTTRSFTINQPAAALSASAAGQTDILCNGSATGSATVTATGGTPGYTYSWSPSGGTAETATGLTAGTYTVTVTDANSCQTTQSFTITEPGALVASPAAQTNIACRDDLTGSATVNATGGAGGYTYSWAPSGGTAATATGLAAGNYTVTVTDANNCQATQAFTIVQPTTALTTTAGTINNTSCYTGGNGTATVIASGGTPSYSYSWNTTPVQTTATASGLSAGTYRVTVTDANGCTANRDFTISQPPALSITPSQTNVSCNGGTNGTATASVSGGTGAGTYTYSWAPTGGTAASATGLQAGTYTVTVKDANNCQIAQSYTIDQPAVLTATQSQTEVLCNGSATGTATVVASGGSPNYSYSWSPSGGTAATATGLTANTYTCTITDNNGCFITKTFIITQPAAPLSATTTHINATCSTGGEASVSPSGGTPSYSYLWSPGGETTPFITGKAAGNYSCIITDANGCTLTKNFTISTTNTLVASAAQTNVLCNGSSTGSASVIPSGAPGPFTYVWAPYGGNTETAVNLSAGNYSVTITSSNGCSIVKTFTITEPSAINITPSQTNVTCNTGSNGSASVTVTGGTGTYTYAWSPSGGTAATANGLSAGTYTVTVKDANLCTKTQSFTITEPNALTPSVSQTNVSCNGGSNGSATVSVTGGTGTYSYQWSPSGGTAATATGLSAGTYTVLIKDSNLCETTASVTIAEPALLTATIDKTDVLCNQANNGTATVIPSGGTGTYTYSWSPSGGTTATATGLSPNTYSVTVTDANGCTVTQTVQITEPNTLSATDTQTNVSCNGGNNGTASVVASGGTGNYSYLWAPSGGTAATATGLTAGTYTVTVTDENSCSVTNTIEITEPDALTLTATTVEVSCYNGNNGSATVNVTGGTGSYTYSWAPSGGTAATATGLTTGTYTVTVTDDNSCTASLTVQILQPVNPVTLNTVAVSGITVNSASLSGTASADGINTDSGSCLTEVGFVYAQHASPTTADTKINISAALGTFTNSLSGLRGNRTYYVRTYAINSNGFVNYGNEVSFTTQKYTLTITAAAGHTKVYGTEDPAFNYTPLGFANGDTPSIITGLLSRDAGENVGKYNIKLGSISAGADYTIAFTGAEFEITKADQTITWDQTLEFGCIDSNNVALTATADSGLPISYTIANAALGTISGSTLNITGSGSSTITAVQNGDQNHNAATAVVKPIEVSHSGLVTQQWANVLFFDNKSNNYVAWQWYKNGVAISGATRQYYSETQPLNGSYYVIAKDKNGNSIKSCPIETTGTVFTKKIKIYPNPVKPGAEFTLECDFSDSQLNGSEVVIYDITGKLVQTISNVKAKNEIIAPSQAALYVVVLKLANGQLKTINLLVK